MRSKLYALSLSLLGGTSLAFVAVSGGCSSSDSGGSSDDTGVATDSGGGDTSPPPADTRKDSHPDTNDTGPFTCAAPLPTDFACKAPKVTAVPGTSCSEDDLQSFVLACIDKNFTVGSGCGAWLTAHPACATCVEGFSFAPGSGAAKVYPDRDQCFYTVFDDTCDTAWSCMFACDDAVCNSATTPCDRTAGSGADGKTSEFDDCVKQERARGGTAVKRGVCYDLATGKALDTCFPTLPGPVRTYCIVGEEFNPTGAGGAPDLTKMRDEVVEFMRGACRDDGDWIHADQPCGTPPCETGTDGGTETGGDSAADADETTPDAGTDTDDGATLPDVVLDTDLDAALDTSLD